MAYKLGKNDPKWSPLTLPLPKYMQSASGSPLPPPEKVFLEYKIPNDVFGMFDNDRLSDCLAAYAAHHLMLITAHTGRLFVPDPVDVVKFYSAFSGYDPSQTDAFGNNPTDNGGYFTDMYRVWETQGLCGYKIDAWASIPTKDFAKRQQAIRLFLGCGVGVQLPASAETQFGAGQNWEYDPSSPTRGGHAIVESGEGSDGHNYGTWGKGDQKASNQWDLNYVDEVYVPLTKQIVSAANDIAPKSLNYDALAADMHALAA
jgi:hypothetical protein